MNRCLHRNCDPMRRGWKCIDCGERLSVEAVRVIVAAKRAELDMAVAWHGASDHHRDGTPFGGPLCNCERVAARAVALGWTPASKESS